MSRTGNYARGSRNGAAKAPDSDVEIVLELHATGLKASEISIKMEIPERTVRSWIKGERRG